MESTRRTTMRPRLAVSLGFSLALLLLTTTSGVQGRSDGAPAHTCADMMPQHGKEPQTSASPYQLLPSKGQGRIRLILGSPQGDGYEGFLILAKDVDTGEIVGEFNNLPEGSARHVECTANKKNGVTHVQPQKIHNLELDWEAPADYEGTIVFNSTICKTWDVFWVGVESPRISVVKRSIDIHSTPPSVTFARATTPPYYNPTTENLDNIGDDQFYEGCGKTKNCFGGPENCVGKKNCQIAVSVFAEGERFIFEVQSRDPNSKYVSVALSDDKKMGDDSVVDCIRENDGARIQMSWNEGKRNGKIETPPGAIESISTSARDGVLSCKFSRSEMTAIQGTQFDLSTKPYHLFIATGTGMKGDSVGYHDLTRVFSDDPTLLSEVGSVMPTIEANDHFYEGCGKTKNCFGGPENCVDKKNCPIAVTVLAEGDRFIFEVQSRDQNSKYVSVALSDDKRMGDDSVVDCIKENDGARIQMSWNQGKSNRKIDVPIGAIEPISTSAQNGVLSCKFYRNKMTTIQGTQFDLLMKPYHLFVATGTAMKGESVGYHDLSRVFSDDPVLLSEVESVEPTTEANIGDDQFYEGCGTRKNCFGGPENCVDSKNCRVVVSVLVEGERYIFEVQSRDKDSKYVSVALSEDDKMGDDSAVDCIRENDSARIQMSWNEGKSNRKIDTPTGAIEPISTSSRDGVLSCKFYRNKITTVQGKQFDLVTKPYHLFVATGTGMKGQSVGYHDLTKVISGEPKLLSDVGSVKSASDLLIRIHGALMLASWIGTASVGMLLARYYRQTWVASQLCGKDQWFAWHRFFMFLTWSMTIAGFVVIFVQLESWSTATYHASLGLATTILCFIQPFMAAMRPHPGAPRRILFNWVHWFVGNAAHICGIVAIFFAVRLAKAKLPEWVDWVLVAYVVFHVLTHFFLTFAGCASDKQGSQRVNSFPMKDVHARNSMTHPDARRDAPHAGLRKLTFGIYFVVIALLAAGLVVITVFAPIEDSWEDFMEQIKSH